MLDGLIITDKNGRKYQLVLINDETPLAGIEEAAALKEFGTWLRQERLRLNITQVQLANISGVLQPNIVAIEKGRRAPEQLTKDALISGLKKITEK